MADENKSLNVETIKKIMNEIIDDLKENLDVYRTHAINVKRQISKDKQESEVLVQTMSSTINEMKEKNERMIDRRNVLRKKIEEDEKEIKEWEEEKLDLIDQIKELEINLNSLKSTYKEKKSKAENLLRKSQMITHKNKLRDDEFSIKAEYFKKYLGINIIPIREDIIKIVFSRVYTDDLVECYVIMDLSSESPVTETYPQLYDIDKVNCIFKEYSNFHEFIKTMRNEFKKEKIY